MRQSTLLRFFLVSLLVAMALGIACFYAVRSVNETSTNEVRRHMVLFIAQSIESAPYTESIRDFHTRVGRRGTTSNLWVLSEEGKVLATSADTDPPIRWESLKKPAAVHEFTFHYRPFRLVPDFTLVKLDAKENVFLLIGSHRPSSSLGGTVWLQVALFLFVGGVAVVIAVVMTLAYLRRKSIEARDVLGRLEKGDLKARFEIKRIDAIGELMGDFNRMVSEIERLVLRVQETETARKNLLEELGHDIRTPLTSLRTSAETLSEHFDQMEKREQKEFVSMIRSELGYFIHLIEDLFFIANLGEPRYKKSTEKIDLRSLIQDEVRMRQARKSRIHWDLTMSPAVAGETNILGDSILIQRLFKNALENAEKHADKRIAIQIAQSADLVTVTIDNDGPPMSDEAIRLFAQRRKTRVAITHAVNERTPGLSLGLGSVIMKTILELHGGSFKIGRGQGGLGTQLILSLPS